jgi:AcrR family transcriptional regulator
MATETREQVDGRRVRGERTRRRILEQAVAIGSQEGLEALTIGRLAEVTGVSKSGLFAHFGSKQDLQLQTVEAARSIFIEEVVTPGSQAEPGIDRLRSTLDAWLSYFERDVFPGGCFFHAASLEYDGRPGPIRNRVNEVMAEWLQLLKQLVVDAELADGADAAQLAFELHAIGLGVNWQRQLFGSVAAIKQAERAFDRLLSGDLPGATDGH